MDALYYSMFSFKEEAKIDSGLLHDTWRKCDTHAVARTYDMIKMRQVVQHVLVFVLSNDELQFWGKRESTTTNVKYIWCQREFPYSYLASSL